MRFIRGRALLVLILATPALAQLPAVKGKTRIEVGQGVPGISFLGTNRSERAIHDFTLLIENDCGRNITKVETSGGRDWDVDDDESGASQGDGETDDDDASPGRLARVDNKGSGNENAPQNVAGEALPHNQIFGVDVTFSGATTGQCDFFLTPTNKEGFQIASSSLPLGLFPGQNHVVVDNDVMVGRGVALGVVNATGGTVVGLMVARPDGLAIGTMAQVDPATDAALAQASCGASLCSLTLGTPVPPGGILALDVALPQLGPGATTELTITPEIAAAVPTMAGWMQAVLCFLLAFSGLVLLLRRRAG